MKIKCLNCNNYARWFYLPGDDDAAYCDKHVPRGCSCNDWEYSLGDCIPDGVEGKDWRWIKKFISWEDLDGAGKQLPCIEFMYFPQGLEDED